MNLKKRISLLNVILIVAITIAQPCVAEQTNVIIILDSSDIQTMKENIQFIENAGGVMTHRFPPNILEGTISADRISALIGKMNIIEATTGTVDLSKVTGRNRVTDAVIGAWNKKISTGTLGAIVANAQPTSQFPPITNDAIIIQRQPDVLSQTVARESSVVTGQAINYPNNLKIYGAGFYDTSEYMTGDIAVGIILPESNGSIDPNLENWTDEEVTNVTAEIISGSDWWIQREPKANLTFTYSFTYEVPTSYEPINRTVMTGTLAEWNQSLWITDAMSSMGFRSFTPVDSPEYYYFINVFDYNNYLRNTLGTDWAYTIFVVDSSIDGDGLFADGFFAYAVLGGSFFVMTYDNDVYGINNMDAVVAHETGHIFYTLDQYTEAGIPCTAKSGYLNIENQNSAYPTAGSCSSNVPSIMRGQVQPYTDGSIDIYAKQQLGWKDSGIHGIFNILDFYPTTIITAHPAQITSNTIPELSMLTTTWSLYPNTNPIMQPWHIFPRHSITTNRVAKTQYRINDGDWTTFNDYGKAGNNSQAYTLTLPPLSDGSYTVYIRAQNTAGNWEVDYPNATFTIETPENLILTILSPVSGARLGGNNSWLTNLLIIFQNNTATLFTANYTITTLAGITNRVPISIVPGTTHQFSLSYGTNGLNDTSRADGGTNNTITIYGTTPDNSTESVTSVTIKVDTTAPGNITNLNRIIGKNYINWSWTNPTNSDFAGVKYRLYNITTPGLVREGYVNKTDILNNSLNATELLSGTQYSIELSTFDDIQ